MDDPDLYKILVQKFAESGHLSVTTKSIATIVDSPTLLPVLLAKLKQQKIQPYASEYKADVCLNDPTKSEYILKVLKNKGVHTSLTEHVVEECLGDAAVTSKPNFEVQVTSLRLQFAVSYCS